MTFAHLLPALLLLGACSQVRIPTHKKNDEPNLLSGWRRYSNTDYRHHLESFGKDFLATDGVSEVPLAGDARAFLENMALSIIQNNELFFNEGARPRFHLVRSPTPFHFSLPGREIFLSTGLIERYIKHEAVLASIVAHELVRSEKSLYNRVVIVPLGYLPLERVLGLNRLGVEDRVEIHKWAYHAMRRARFDGEYYLAWLQLMNRNTTEFLPLVGDPQAIPREEALFKAFMIRRAKQEDARTVAQKDSSKAFYRFLFYVKDRT